MVSKRRSARTPKAVLGADEHTRQHIAAEAARIMSDEGVRDFQMAKRKAANRLNIANNKRLPTNQEIEAALQAYLQLFHAARLTDTLNKLRAVALEAMRFLGAFAPRLVGPVLSGTVTPYSVVQLHVRADTPEQIGLLLDDHNIPFEEIDKRLRFGGDRYERCPVYRFTADTCPIEVYVFSPLNGREPPLSPVDGKPMQRATIKQVERLLP
ncbi:MAG: hypothetical protein ACE5K1_00385 [Acidiferrobacterales bacterium]